MRKEGGAAESFDFVDEQDLVEVRRVQDESQKGARRQAHSTPESHYDDEELRIDFDDSDLDEDHSSSGAVNIGDDQISGLGALDDKPQDLSRKNLKTRMIIGGVICVMVISLGGLGYYAYRILSNGGNSVAVGNPEQALTPALENPQVAASNEAISALERGLAKQPEEESAARSMEGNPFSGEASTNNEEITSPGNDAASTEDVRIVPNINLPETKPASELTEEEQMYDNLLGTVQGTNIPPEAIKIDQGVIRNELTTKRVDGIEKEVMQTRSDLSGFHQVIIGINTSMKELSASVAANNAKQEEIAKEVDRLAKELGKINGSVDEAVKLANQAIKASDASTRPTASSVAANTKPKPVSKPEPKQQNIAQSTSQSQPSAPVTQNKALPQPKAQPAVVRADDARTNSLPRQCDGRVVSANWKVKGVNAAAAYVVRVQDNQGVFLKRGVEVPGFGSVVAFDPGMRAVCTTSGLIKR